MRLPDREPEHALVEADTVIPGTPRALRSTAVFLQAPGSMNDHDLGLFQVGDAAGPSAAGRETVREGVLENTPP